MYTDAAINLVANYLRHSPVHYRKGSLLRRVLEPLCAPQPRYRIAHTVAGTFCCNLQDFVSRTIWLWGVWEPFHTSYVRRYLRPGDVFVDVGANVGWFTVLAGNLGAKVISFEPLPSIFIDLQNNVKMNGLSPRLVRAAIADMEGETRVYRAGSGNSGLSTTEGIRGYAFEAMAPILPLHVALTGEEICNARLIKIDTEGACVQAARGILPMLPQTRPDLEILMELDVDDDPAWPGLVADMFAEAGFKAYALDNDYSERNYARRPTHFEAPRCDPSTRQFTDVLFSRRDEPVLRWDA
jgi:FkbM family methyltransferase